MMSKKNYSAAVAAALFSLNLMRKSRHDEAVVESEEGMAQNINPFSN